MTPVTCRGCGNDEGPYNGWCLDCLEAGLADGQGRWVSPADLRLLLSRASSRADCRRRQVGAVLVGTCGSVHGLGWNALPTGSCTGGDCPRGLLSYSERPASSSYAGNCIAVHAEVAAIRAAGTYALNGVMYITDEPCPGCREAMADARVTWEVVTGLRSSPDLAPAAR